MKQKDIALIIVIAIISGVASYFISNKIFVNSTATQQKVEKVDVITADFPTPSDKYFNKDSFNPATNIQIGNGSNQNPFSGQ